MIPGHFKFVHPVSAESPAQVNAKCKAVPPGANKVPLDALQGAQRRQDPQVVALAFAVACTCLVQGQPGILILLFESLDVETLFLLADQGVLNLPDCPKHDAPVVCQPLLGDGLCTFDLPPAAPAVQDRHRDLRGKHYEPVLENILQRIRRECP